MTALAAHEKQHTETYDIARLIYVRELGTAKSHPNTLGNGYQIGKIKKNYEHVIKLRKQRSSGYAPFLGWSLEAEQNWKQWEN